MLKLIATIGTIQVGAILANVARSKATAVLLGPEGVGIISIVDQTLQLVLQISILSLPFVAAKYLSRAHSRGFDDFQDNYARFLRLILGLSVIGALGALALAFGWPQVLGFVVEYKAFLVIAMIALPTIALQALFRLVLAAAQRARSAATLDVVAAVVFTVAVIAGMLAGGISGYYVGYLAAGIAIAAGTAVYLRRSLGLRVRGAGPGLAPLLRDNPGIATFATINYVIGFTTPLTFLIARYAVLGRFGEAEAGLLQAAIAISLALMMVLNATNGLYLMPAVNRDMPVADKLAAAVEFERKILVAIAALGMPIALFPEWLVELLFTAEFLEVARLVFLFVVAQAILQLAGVFNVLLLGVDRLKAYGAILVVSQIPVAAVSWLLVPSLGIAGVGVAFLVTAVANFGLGFAELARAHGLAFPARLWISIGYVVIGLAAAGALATGYDPWHPAVIAAKLAVYGLFLAGAVGLTLTSGERRELLRHSVAAMARVRGRA